MRDLALGAFVAAVAQRFGGLGLDQFLQAGADQFGEHGRHIGALEGVEAGQQCKCSWVIEWSFESSHFGR
ncbi:hypothetical protein C8K36_1163 [Rhodococcus sp. OK519]|jgi:hypothetical protein|nr:hypothetical protein C8K36_1163 [Rhodococcus sp. OK519]